MSKLEKALTAVADRQNHEETSGSFSPVALTLCVLVYLGILVSASPLNLIVILQLGIIPMVLAPVTGLAYGSVLGRSLAVLPFVAAVGIFNPLYDHTPAFRIATVVVSQGWLSFAGLAFRGIFAVQAVLILVSACGFRNVCAVLGKIGVPAFLVNQLLMVYRYITVLLEEALTMRRARESRGYGVKAMPFKSWGRFVGDLFLRSFARAERIHMAMSARGYTGQVTPFYFTDFPWRRRDTLLMVLLPAASLLLRLCQIW